jgi:hypothetical protein
MKKTTLSIAISLALYGGVPAADAQQQPTQLPERQQQQTPQLTGECQQPESGEVCIQPVSLPPQPAQIEGDGQQQPPQPGDDGQQQPPQPGGDGQQQPPQPGGDGQQQPPQPGDGEQQQPPQPGGDGQQQPPQPGDDGQQQPPQPGDDGQQQPPQPGGDGQQQPPQPGGDGQQQPPQPGGDGQQQPPQPGDDGQQQPPQPGDDGQQQPPQPGGDGQQQPPQPGGDGQQPTQPGGDGQQQPPQPGGDGQQPGTPLTFSPRHIPSLPERVKLPPLPDFSQGLGSNGQTPSGQTDVLDGLNQGLAQGGFPQFTFQQRDDGPLNVKGTGAAEGTKFAFIPQTNRMTQQDDNAPIGLSRDEKRGQYTITTPDRQKIPFIPAPNDPTCVLDATGEQGSVEMGEDGDVLLKIPGQQRTVAGIFDPMVAEQSDMEPGIHFVETAEGEEEAIVACEDGTAQQMRPTVSSPKQLIERGMMIDGVEDITHRKDDGTFDVTFNGQPLKLEPTFDVESESLAEGEQVEPEISIVPGPNLHLKYTVQSGNQRLRFKLKIR